MKRDLCRAAFVNKELLVRQERHCMICGATRTKDSHMWHVPFFLLQMLLHPKQRAKAKACTIRKSRSNIPKLQQSHCRIISSVVFDMLISKLYHYKSTKPTHKNRVANSTGWELPRALVYGIWPDQMPPIWAYNFLPSIKTINISWTLKPMVCRS